jgi:hypothetical protein
MSNALLWMDYPQKQIDKCYVQLRMTNKLNASARESNHKQ